MLLQPISVAEQTAHMCMIPGMLILGAFFTPGIHYQGWR